MKLIKILMVAIAISLVTGCASYRTNSDLTFESTTDLAEPTKVEILETGLEVGTYESLGPVTGLVEKQSIFYSNPSKRQVNLVLEQKALELNADAVINVQYHSGIGLMTWGYMEGKGIAVKKKASK